MAKGIYNTLAWRKVRPFILVRDSFKCQIGLPGCTGSANHVDHIVEWPEGPAFEPSNLQAACAHCNSVKRHRREAARKRPSLRRW